MNRWEIEHAVKQALLAGYTHYSRAEEIRITTALLLDAKTPIPKLPINKFPLADQPLRSIKNNLIALVAIVCRAAADLGADDMKSYMFSDYYINEIEEHASGDNWKKIFRDVVLRYGELVREGREGNYSPQVKRTIRYIKRRLFEPCTLRDLARDIQVTPNYLSSLFKKETGLTLTRYIQNLKIEEAKRMILNREHRLGDIADMLGFASLSYFSRVFKRLNLCSPRNYLEKARIPAPPQPGGF
ncbi:MAG: helix-turn-helix domain-containing protein [Treponema sp.]|jgi:YesN/AraC family two-component response regulator|nr:helix-turn-helix domain-containing protein [Treponema sp.]